LSPPLSLCQKKIYTIPSIAELVPFKQTGCVREREEKRIGIRAAEAQIHAKKYLQHKTPFALANTNIGNVQQYSINRDPARNVRMSKG